MELSDVDTKGVQLMNVMWNPELDFGTEKKFGIKVVKKQGLLFS